MKISKLLQATAAGLVLSASLPALAQVKIGVMASSTGPIAFVGMPQKNAVALLPKKIGDYNIEYLVFDDASDPTQSVQVAKKLLGEHKIDALIGPSGSGNAMGVLAFMAEAQTPMLAPVGTSAVVLIPYTLLPNVIDVDELMTGEQRSGLYSGSMVFTRKIVQGLIAMPAIGFVLSGIGFVSKAAQTPDTLAKFGVFFLGGPLLLIVGGILAATRLKLSPLNSEVLRLELERLRAGGAKSEVAPETKAICESLTGIAWEKCWPLENKKE